MIRLFLMLAMVLAMPARADVTDRLEAAFRSWAGNVGAQTAVMTIALKGEPRRDVVVGSGAADRAVEIASLSKAITAACVAHLIEDGVWTPETSSADVLGAGDITVVQLLTHVSGLGPDHTQSSMPRWLDKSGRRAQKAALRALEREQQDGTQGAFAYNNENYAVLGTMIEAETGAPYEEYCTDKVLIPAGVTTAQPSARSQRFLPWGGWQMSVQDYAAFHWHVFGPEGIIGQDPGKWPAADVGRGAQYGMGTFQRAMRGTHNYWHFGALCFPGRLNIGSYAVIWLGDYSVAAAYDICPDWDQMGALDKVLVEAVFQ